MSTETKDLTVAHITTVHPRHDTRIFVKECISLKNIGYDVHLLVADGLGDSIENDIRIHDLGSLSKGRFNRFLAGSVRVFNHIRKLRPKLCHIHDPELLPIFILLSLMRYKVVYDLHEDVPRQVLAKFWIPAVFRRPISWLVSFIEWLGFINFSGFISATPTIAQRFSESKTIVVRNYPDLNELYSHKFPDYTERSNTVTYIGGITEIRGIREIVRAMSMLPDALECQLVLAGSFSPESLYTEMSSEPGWKRTNFVGWASREDVASILASAKVGLVTLHPTINYIDAYPVKMFEYMAAGIPVIASDFPLWRNIVEKSACGLLVDPLDPSAIAEAVSWLMQHPHEAENMGRKGQKAVADSYNWEHESQTLHAFYQHILTPS